MVKQKSGKWSRIYQEALAETDQERLLAKISMAESALSSRLRQMHHEPTHREEAIALYDAVHSLRLLRCDLHSRTRRQGQTLLRERSL